MTANASFYVTEKKNIVLLPASALSFHANPQLLDAYQESHPEIKIQQILPGDLTKDENSKLIWIKKGNTISPQKVVLGETDEINYEVLLGVNEGDEVITGSNSSVTESETKETEAKSPFMPEPPGSNRKN